MIFIDMMGVGANCSIMTYACIYARPKASSSRPCQPGMSIIQAGDAAAMRRPAENICLMTRSLKRHAISGKPRRLVERFSRSVYGAIFADVKLK